MTPIPFNLATLKDRSFLQLDDAHTHLVAPLGGKKAGLRNWKIRAGGLTPGQLKEVERTIVFGDVTLAYRASQVSVRHGASAQWNTNVLDFAGAPKLRVTPSATEVLIEFTGARFAGLQLSADFTARLTLANGAAQIELSFPFCAFRASGPLATWLEHATKLSAPVLWDDDLCRITDGVRLRAAGVAGATFFPGWLFVFGASTPFVSLASAGTTVAAKVFALAPLAKDMPHLLPNPARRRSAFFVPEPAGFRLPLWPERTEGWQFRQPVTPFRALLVENHEETDGDIRRGLLAWGDPTDFIGFAPGGGLRDTNGGEFLLPLNLPIYAAAFDGTGHRLGAAVLAVRPNVPVVAHTERCTLVLGSVLRERPEFCLLDLAGHLYLGPIPVTTKIKAGLRFTLLGTALRPIVDETEAAQPLVSDPLPPTQRSTITLTLDGNTLVQLPTEGQITLADASPAPILLPENLIMQLVRPRDLLVLNIWFCRARPSFAGPDGRILPGAEGDPRIVVFLPPQNIGEGTVPETEEDKHEQPDNGKLPLGAIIHRTAAPSRLAFAFPSGTSFLPFSLRQLLDWSGLTMTPALDKRALRSVDLPVLDTSDLGNLSDRPVAHLGNTPGISGPASAGVHPMMNIPLRPPAPDVTAIEAPYRLLMSPDQFGVWKTLAGDRGAARSVPWLAALSTTRRADEYPPVRAIWAIGNNDGVSASALGDDGSLSADNRWMAVANSAKKAVDARRLMLSSLGAWLDYRGDWSDVETDNSLDRWLHRATLGRDQYVEIVERGYLFPFGHKAVLITITERKFGQHPPGRVGAWLRKRRFIVVREPVRDYAQDVAGTTAFKGRGDGRALPFRQVRLVTHVTPLLDPPVNIVDDGNPATTTPTNFWPQVAQKEYYFNLAGTDWAGGTVEFCAPLAFVRYNEAKDPALVAQVLANQKTSVPGPGDQSRRFRYQFGGQPVAFATPDTASQAAGNTTLEVESMKFEGFAFDGFNGGNAARPVYPLLTSTRALAPLHRQFDGSATPSDLVYHDRYVTGGFGAKNTVFLRYESPQACAFGSSNSNDKVGGLATPGLNVGALSRRHGLVGIAPEFSDPTVKTVKDQLNGFDGAGFNPKSYFGGVEAKLLGGLDLKDLLGAIDTATDDQIPRWTTDTLPGEITRRLHWSTQELEDKDGILFTYDEDPDNASTLTLDCVARIKTATGATDTQVKATLNNFAIDLAGIIRVPFNRFDLSMKVGRKPDVAVDVGTPTFDGALAFLSTLQDALGVGSFAKGSGIDITPAGVSIGYSLAVPTIAVGAFSLQNLAISTSATLPFTGDPFRLRFAISERQSPFIVTVSIFGGGGFFALGAGIDGIDTLEISLEFGGNFTLDIGIASGGAHVMAGLYFKVGPTSCILTGYVRAGGELNVLGLISISCEFYLALTYEQQGNCELVWGEASLTVEISILFFSFDVTLTVRREFAGTAADPTFADTVTTDDWANHNLAFAE